MKPNRYHFSGIESGNLPTHCERVAEYWATLTGVYSGSGKGAGQFYKSTRAFRRGLTQAGLPAELVEQAFRSTLELARVKANAE